MRLRSPVRISSTGGRCRTLQGHSDGVRPARRPQHVRLVAYRRPLPPSPALVRALAIAGRQKARLQRAERACHRHCHAHVSERGLHIRQTRSAEIKARLGAATCGGPSLKEALAGVRAKPCPSPSPGAFSFSASFQSGRSRAGGSPRASRLSWPGRAAGSMPAKRNMLCAQHERFYKTCCGPRLRGACLLTER